MWEKIFNKSSHPWNKSVKKNSIKLYQVIYPSISSKNISKYFKFLFQNYNFKNFFDYGSGNGAILFYVYQNYNCKNLYSFDISKNFIKIQKKILKKKIKIINFKKLKVNDYKFDLTLCNSVSQYFKNKKKFFITIEKLIKMSDKVIVSDIIPSKGYKKFLKKKLKRERISHNVFKIKYKNLDHLHFYKKDFLYLKKKFNVKIIFEPMPKYHPDSIGRFLIRIKK